MKTFQTAQEAREYMILENGIDAEYENTSGYRCTIEETIELMEKGQVVHRDIDYEYYSLEK